MKVAKVLFTTDFSKLSDAALPFAASLARDRSAELIILHVQEPPSAYIAADWYYGPVEPDQAAVRKMLEAVTPPFGHRLCIHRLEVGDPASEILRVAKEEGADIIVIGSHGRTGLARILMGSVAEQVVRRANCPVFVFKSPRIAANPPVRVEQPQTASSRP